MCLCYFRKKLWRISVTLWKHMRSLRKMGTSSPTTAYPEGGTLRGQSPSGWCSSTTASCWPQVWFFPTQRVSVSVFLVGNLDLFNFFGVISLHTLSLTSLFIKKVKIVISRWLVLSLLNPKKWLHKLYLFTRSWTLGFAFYYIDPQTSSAKTTRPIDVVYSNSHKICILGYLWWIEIVPEVETLGK